VDITPLSLPVAVGTVCAGAVVTAESPAGSPPRPGEEVLSPDATVGFGGAAEEMILPLNICRARGSCSQLGRRGSSQDALSLASCPKPPFGGGGTEGEVQRRGVRRAKLSTCRATLRLESRRCTEPRFKCCRHE